VVLTLDLVTSFISSVWDLEYLWAQVWFQHQSIATQKSTRPCPLILFSASSFRHRSKYLVPHPWTKTHQVGPLSVCSFFSPQKCYQKSGSAPMNKDPSSFRPLLFVSSPQKCYQSLSPHPANSTHCFDLSNALFFRHRSVIKVCSAPRTKTHQVLSCLLLLFRHRSIKVWFPHPDPSSSTSLVCFFLPLSKSGSAPMKTHQVCHSLVWFYCHKKVSKSDHHPKIFCSFFILDSIVDGCFDS
jgi:hypothetical protein